MKRKFLILTLCFTIIFSSLNYKKSYAIDFVISPTILAVVSTLAVGTGIALKNADDVLDIGRLFYDYVERNNNLTWDVIKTTFESAKVLNDTILINSGILDITKGFFDTQFKDKNYDMSFAYSCSVPVFESHDQASSYVAKNTDFLISDILKSQSDFKSQGVDFRFKNHYPSGNSYSSYDVYIGKNRLFLDKQFVSSWRDAVTMAIYKESNGRYMFKFFNGNSPMDIGTVTYWDNIYGSVGTLPYEGTYDWDSNIEDKKEGNGDLPLPIPGDLGNLVGKNPSDVWDKNYEGGLVGSKPITIPNVDNPSISVSGDDAFTSDTVTDTPTDPPTDIPGVENPPVGVIPPFPSFGNSLDFSPMYLTNINEKFPFSLPWDIGRLIEKFDIEPKAPIFKVPIFTSEIVLDLTIFDEWANIVRFFVLIGFVLSLILISTKLLG